MTGQELRPVLGTCAQARRHLLSVSPKNVEAIQAIESAILVVCLDDLSSPSLDGSARSWNIYTGGQDNSAAGKARNRWFDKHQWIIDENAETGFNGERESPFFIQCFAWNDLLTRAILLQIRCWTEHRHCE
jgi:hypothetical protein